MKSKNEKVVEAGNDAGLKHISKIIYFVLLAVAFIGGYALFHRLGMAGIRSFIVSLGPFAPAGYIILMALAVVVSPIPSIPLDIMAGALFGGFLGGLYSVVGATFGAVIAFMISRKLGRTFLIQNFQKDINLCDNCYRYSIAWIIFFMRLLPVFQFDIISYAAGLTKVRLWKFVLATALGMMPVTFLLSYTGETIMLFGFWLNIILTIVILVAMFAVPKYLSRRGLLRRYKK